MSVIDEVLKQNALREEEKRQANLEFLKEAQSKIAAVPQTVPVIQAWAQRKAWWAKQKSLLGNTTKQ